VLPENNASAERRGCACVFRIAPVVIRGMIGVLGEPDLAYDYWVLGKGTEHRAPRWSIARDVLGWTE